MLLSAWRIDEESLYLFEWAMARRFIASCPEADSSEQAVPEMDYRTQFHDVMRPCRGDESCQST